MGSSVGRVSLNHTISFTRAKSRLGRLEDLARVKARCPENIVQALVGSQKI